MRKPIRIPFWKKTRKLLKAKTKIKKNFAESMGLNNESLRFWLSYGYYPDVKTAYDIADALGVSMEYLLFGKDQLAIKDASGKFE